MSCCAVCMCPAPEDGERKRWNSSHQSIALHFNNQHETIFFSNFFLSFFFFALFCVSTHPGSARPHHYFVRENQEARAADMLSDWTEYVLLKCWLWEKGYQFLYVICVAHWTRTVKLIYERRRNVWASHVVRFCERERAPDWDGMRWSESKSNAKKKVNVVIIIASQC